MMRLFLAVLVLVLAGCDRPGSPTEPTLAGVHGFVTHAGEPLRGVTVSTRDKSAVTDSDGEYQIGRLDAGEAIIRFAGTGQKRTGQSIPVDGQKTVTLRLGANRVDFAQP